jgi:hypothetical protein
VKPLGWQLTWGSGAAAPVAAPGPVWAHSEIVMDTRTFNPRIRTTILVQDGSKVSTIPADDTERWPK